MADPSTIVQPSAAHVLKLPPELLAHIFILHRDEIIATATHVYKWIVVSHVCRHFREVALASAKLWAVILFPESGRSLICSRRTKAITARSNQVPLLVKLNDESDDLLALIKTELHRIYSLSMRLSDSSSVNKTPAPILRKLSIHAYKQAHDIVWSDMFGPVGTPKLEEVHITSSIGLSLADSHIFPKTLRILEIIQHNRRPRPLSELVGILREVDNLEQLSLEGMLPFAPPTEDLPKVEVPVLLRRLTHFTIVGSASRCAVFLSNIRTPRLLHSKIKCVITSRSGIIHLTSMACARLNDALPSHPPDPFLTFALDESSSPTETRFVAWSSSEHFQGLPLADSQPSRMFSISVTHDHWGELLPTFIAQLPLCSVTRVFIAVGDHSDSQFANQSLEAWSAAFQTLVDVHEIRVASRRDLPFRKPGSTAKDHVSYPRRRVDRNTETAWDEELLYLEDEWDGPEGALCSMHESMGRSGKNRLEMRREMEQLRRFHAYNTRRRSEQEEMLKKLRNMFPSMRICGMNDFVYLADPTGPRLVLNVPLIPHWSHGNSNWPFVSDTRIRLLS